MAEGGGGGANGRLGPLPVWAWALLAGGGIGLIWFLRSRGSSSSSTSTDTADQTGSGVAPIMVTPSNEGLSQAQFAQIMSAINALQGPPSTTTPPPDGSPVFIGHGPGNLAPIPPGMFVSPPIQIAHPKPGSAQSVPDSGGYWAIGNPPGTPIYFSSN